jgi:Holliday junction resolvasome RuvABC endonuclease subunit
MKTIILPDGKTAAADDIDGITPYVDHTPRTALNAVLGVGHSKRAQVGHSS